MPAGQLSKERLLIPSEDYTNYSELPLVKTGCDSYASWDPHFKHLSHFKDVDTIADEIIALLPHKEWRDEHLVITGGEPLLTWQKAFPALLDHPKMHDLKEITFETNGTQRLTDTFTEYLNAWHCTDHRFGSTMDDREITFSVSAKLSNSGELQANAIRPEIVCEYETVGFTYLKFVVATNEDIEEALDMVQLYRGEGFEGPVYLMPVGGTESVYQLNNRNVAEAAMKHGLRYSDRLQVPLFKNEWGT